MSGNLAGFRSSGRVAALLTFRGEVILFESFHWRLLGGKAGIVAAGMNPAAKQMSA
jgi:hypothetical protein